MALVQSEKIVAEEVDSGVVAGSEEKIPCTEAAVVGLGSFAAESVLEDLCIVAEAVLR